MSARLRVNGCRVQWRPYRHFAASNAIPEDLAERVLSWFENGAPWSRRHVEGFYDSYDINLRTAELPESLNVLRSEQFLLHLRSIMQRRFGGNFEEKVDIQAHKLVPGYRMGVHSDYGPFMQTHRLLLYVNRGWSPSSGGVLIVLPQEDPFLEKAKHKYYLPLHGTVIGFEISKRSYHAVTEVLAGDRFTIAYSFYKSGGYFD